MSAHLRIPRLIAQAHATLARVADDRPVSESLGQAFIAEVKVAVDLLETMARAVPASYALSKMAKLRQDDAQASAKAWHRAFTNLASRALVRGLEVPREVVECRCGSGGAASVAADVDRLLELGRKFHDVLLPLGVTAALLQEGQRAVDALRAADARQELLHGEGRRIAVREMRKQAGIVLSLVKEMNAAGRAVHVHDRAKRKPYTLAILRRGAPPRDEAPPGPAVA